MLMPQAGPGAGHPHPVLGANNICHEEGACAAGRGTPTSATRDRINTGERPCNTADQPAWLPRSIGVPLRSA